jgi:hypothetical protein
MATIYKMHLVVYGQVNQNKSEYIIAKSNIVENAKMSLPLTTTNIIENTPRVSNGINYITYFNELGVMVYFYVTVIQTRDVNITYTINNIEFTTTINSREKNNSLVFKSVVNCVLMSATTTTILFEPMKNCKCKLEFDTYAKDDSKSGNYTIKINDSETTTNNYMTLELSGHNEKFLYLDFNQTYTISIEDTNKNSPLIHNTTISQPITFKTISGSLSLTTPTVNSVNLTGIMTAEIKSDVEKVYINLSFTFNQTVNNQLLFAKFIGNSSDVINRNFHKQLTYVTNNQYKVTFETGSLLFLSAYRVDICLFDVTNKSYNTTVNNSFLTTTIAKPPTPSFRVGSVLDTKSSFYVYVNTNTIQEISFIKVKRQELNDNSIVSEQYYHFYIKDLIKYDGTIITTLAGTSPNINEYVINVPQDINKIYNIWVQTNNNVGFSDYAGDIGNRFKTNQTTLSAV